VWVVVGGLHSELEFDGYIRVVTATAALVLEVCHLVAVGMMHATSMVETMKQRVLNSTASSGLQVT